MIGKLKGAMLAVVTTGALAGGAAAGGPCYHNEYRTCYVKVCYTAYDCNGCPYKEGKGGRES